MGWQNGTIKELIQQQHDCLCGRVHTTCIKEVKIEHQLVDKMSQDVQLWGYKLPYIVSDSITEQLLGAQLKQVLKGESQPFGEYVYERDQALVPDEKALGEILIEYPKGCDLIIGVGSGTLNDICRFLSYKMEIPYWIIGTAPSMDGYASTASPLIVNHLKNTYYCHEPERILGDLSVLSLAPMVMLSAGVGDLLGKYTALTDWRVGQVITGEYYCEAIVELVEIAVKKCIESIEELI
ncbi:MAG: iron-containing alcohol dehydrogenase, partial [Vallitaleaceae bacterium]|nr:iron-containing alcohol dehydrogenase [Vallitaleaceae bacterium]